MLTIMHRSLRFHRHCLLHLPLHCRLEFADVNKEEDQYHGLDEPWLCVSCVKTEGFRTAKLTQHRSFAFAVVKIVANTALLGKPDVNALLCEQLPCAVRS